MKSLTFLGDSLKRLRDLPADAKQDIGYQLDAVQRGQQPDDFKPMPAIGKGVEEIRVWDEAGTYRVIHTARLANSLCAAPVSKEITGYHPAGYRPRQTALRRITGELNALTLRGDCDDKRNYIQ